MEKNKINALYLNYVMFNRMVNVSIRSSEYEVIHSMPTRAIYGGASYANTRQML